MNKGITKVRRLSEIHDGDTCTGNWGKLTKPKWMLQIPDRKKNWNKNEECS